MDKYKLWLLIGLILFVLYILYWFIKYFISLSKVQRLSYYSIKIKEDNNKNLIFKIIEVFSRILNCFKIFDSYSKIYDKYIYEKSRLNNGMDYVAIKILLGLVFIIFNIISFLILNCLFNVVTCVTLFIIGFIIPDIYCILVKNVRTKKLYSELHSAFGIFRNSYITNNSVEMALIDVVNKSDESVKYEFKRVLDDIRLGLEFKDAFYRMYLRINIPILLYCSKLFMIAEKNNFNILEILIIVDNKMKEEEKLNNSLLFIKDINKIAFFVFSLLPLVFFIVFILLNNVYHKLFFNVVGVCSLLILVILYLLYVFIIKRISRGVNYED